MKKTLLFAAAVAALVAFFGCSSSPSATGAAGIDDTVNGVPVWVANMSLKSNTAHYEVGYGRGSSRATAQKRAEADARNKIAMWLETDVQTVLITYTQDAGIGDETEMIEFMEEISRQTAEASLSGAAIKSVYIDREGGVYVLMSYDINALAENLQSRVDSYVRNESAAFAEFKADEALRVLLDGED